MGEETCCSAELCGVVAKRWQVSWAGEEISIVWGGIGVINLGRKPMWLRPLPVYVDPVVLESLPRWSPGMHRSPVTLKRD